MLFETGMSIPAAFCGTRIDFPAAFCTIVTRHSLFIAACALIPTFSARPFFHLHDLSNSLTLFVFKCFCTSFGFLKILIFSYLILARCFTNLQARRGSGIRVSSRFSTSLLLRASKIPKAPEARRSTYYRLPSALFLFLDQEKIQSTKRSVHLHCCDMARYVIVSHFTLCRYI